MAAKIINRFRKVSILLLVVFIALIVSLVLINKDYFYYNYIDNSKFSATDLTLQIERNDHNDIPYKFLPNKVYVIYAGKSLTPSDAEMLASLEWLSFQFTWSKNVEFVAFTTLEETVVKEHQDMSHYNPMYTVLCRQPKVVNYLHYKVSKINAAGVEEMPLLVIIKNNKLLHTHRGFFNKAHYKALIPKIYEFAAAIELPPLKAREWKARNFVD